MGFLFAAGTVVFLVGVAGVAGAIWHFSKDLPDYSQLQDYEPPVMTRVHAVGRLAARRILQGAPSLSADPGGSEARHQRVPRRRGQELLRTWRHRLLRHGARGGGVCAELRLRPPPAGRLHDHPAGREELSFTNEVSFSRKIKEALLGDAHRARLFQGQDPRALSE